MLQSIKELRMAKYPWSECMSDQMKEYGNKDTAQKVCGSIKARNSKLAQIETTGRILSAKLDSLNKS